jgi:hypothetical protein
MDEPEAMQRRAVAARLVVRRRLEGLRTTRH